MPPKAAHTLYTYGHKKTLITKNYSWDLIPFEIFGNCASYEFYGPEFVGRYIKKSNEKNPYTNNPHI